MSAFVLNTILVTNVQDTVKHFTTVLKDEGFGVRSTLDFSEIIASKTGHPFKGRLVGLGVCMPELDLQALELDPTVAALLPCDEFIAETSEGTSVGFLDPHTALSLTEDHRLGSSSALKLLTGSSMRWPNWNDCAVHRAGESSSRISPLVTAAINLLVLRRSWSQKSAGTAFHRSNIWKNRRTPCSHVNFIRQPHRNSPACP